MKRRTSLLHVPDRARATTEVGAESHTQTSTPMGLLGLRDLDAPRADYLLRVVVAAVVRARPGTPLTFWKSQGCHHELPCQSLEFVHETRPLRSDRTAITRNAARIRPEVFLSHCVQRRWHRGTPTVAPKPFNLSRRFQGASAVRARRDHLELS